MLRKGILSFVIVLLSMGQIFAQIAGAWKGAIETAGMKLQLTFHIEDKDGQLSATLDVPDQGATGIPVDKVAYEHPDLTLSISAAGINYQGKVADNEIQGVFKQGGQELPLNLVKTKLEKPGDVSLPSSEADIQKLIDQGKGNYTYAVDDYFKKPASFGFQLSPNGKYISYQEKDDKGKNHVYVKETTSGTITRAIEEKEELIKGYGWINDERLVYVMDKGGDENFHLYATDINGGNTKDLTPYDGVQASILNMLKEQKDYIIVSMNKDNKQVHEPYKINVVTGESEKLYTNDDVTNPIVGYDFDKDGKLRAYAKMKNGTTTQLYFKLDDAPDFHLASESKWDEGFGIVAFNYASPNPDDAYMTTNLDSDKTRIVLYDFKAKKILKEVYSNKDYDASMIGLSRKRNWEIDYLGYVGEKVQIVPVSATFKQIYSQLEKQFSGYQYTIVGKTDDEDKWLIVVQSDKLYGKYYLYDIQSDKATLLYDLMPQLKEGDMAVMKPITFKSRDGLTIHGYITLPKAALEGKKVPLIVNPHGGPQGVRDNWGFNFETQLFASRGYATLQVNFRISGGYGKAFLRAGFKQIGRKAMDDVEDGVKYAIAQGWVDKDNIAIYGGSHGGYATLMGLVKTPELYKAGVDYVGVSNIETFFGSIPEYWKPYMEMLQEIWYDLDNPEEAKVAKEVSPFFQLDKINKPLFVVQGANDPRVNIHESDQIVKALRAKGFDVPYLVKYNEGHGFHHEENSIEFYKAMMGFFKQHLK